MQGRQVLFFSYLAGRMKVGKDGFEKEIIKMVLAVGLRRSVVVDLIRKDHVKNGHILLADKRNVMHKKGHGLLLL